MAGSSDRRRTRRRSRRGPSGGAEDSSGEQLPSGPQHAAEGVTAGGMVDHNRIKISADRHVRNGRSASIGRAAHRPLRGEGEACDEACGVGASDGEASRSAVGEAPSDEVGGEAAEGGKGRIGGLAELSRGDAEENPIGERLQAQHSGGHKRRRSGGRWSSGRNTAAAAKKPRHKRAEGSVAAAVVERFGGPRGGGLRAINQICRKGESRRGDCTTERALRLRNGSGRHTAGAGPRGDPTK